MSEGVSAWTVRAAARSSEAAKRGFMGDLLLEKRWREETG
jgi:hypothetical protein